GFGPRELAGTSLAKVADEVRAAGCVRVGADELLFDVGRDVVFDSSRSPIPHPNTMRFSVVDPAGNEALSETYVSVGGGRLAGGEFGPLPEPAPSGGAASRRRGSAGAVVSACARQGIDLVEHVYRIEESEYRHPRAEADAYVDEMWALMRSATDRGLAAEGALPGSLRLQRRARALYGRFLEQLPHFHVLSPEASLASIYAIAVAEENAAGGAVVTAPTCGSCGVVPACLRVVEEKMGLRRERIRAALLVAAWIGAVIAADASISGAEVGCQGEIGAASAMAAGAVCYLLGGSVSDQVDRAAESALEHYLGLTCDPVDGLVQIPCIERNAAGAVSALNAAGLAMISSGGDRVSFDEVVDAMRRTGLDLDSRYKETALGGLATTPGIDG
ncbi:MAG: L-serine ammonia-lyase, iron-sulfur-dependent, subunit alpha, partial [Candidatus Bipolaricaulota bacterium]|nr:L-serine ammonia-lyase, iron-sulfur-dependent, subunit alpha [Candidatus Bipolaricaulota bacterium]